jgi:hypothetical protein
MNAALDMVVMAAEPTEPYGGPIAPRHVPPQVERPPYTAREIYALFKGGEVEADRCEALLGRASRARGGIDLSIGEGLDALQTGERLPRLGHHLPDYAREHLDMAERTARNLAFLARQLRTRPLLREAVRSGRVCLRAAQAVLPVAVGDAEGQWVERAAHETVRALQAAVCETGRAPEEADEPWMRFSAEATPEERALIDEALAMAARLVPSPSRIEQLEAMSQEFLGQFPGDPSQDGKRRLSTAFRPLGASPDERKAALEAETDRWSILPPVDPFPAPEVSFDSSMTAEQVDAQLRELAALRAGWDDVIGFCATAIKESHIYQRFGFATFAHYVEERLGVPASTVGPRVALEKRLRESPALQEARRQKLPYEKLRALSRLPEAEIGSWVPRAHALTVIELRRRLEADHEARMCAARRITARLPMRAVVLLDAAIQSVRDAAGMQLPAGTCLAVIARHSLETWRGAVPRRTRSQRLRERDGNWCTVPGCSHRSQHEHHVVFRGRGGWDEDENKTGVCGYHHLRCIHPGHVKVWGQAPDGLTWIVGGRVWKGAKA